MKSKFNYLLATLFASAAFLGFSFTEMNPRNGATNVDLTKSTINWKGYKVTGQHHGTVNLKSGNLEFKEGKLTGGSFEIDMNSISCLDLQGEWKGKLEGHLKSDDFFGAAKFPVAKFVITKVISRGTPGGYKLVGNLTIKETTKEIKFDATVTESGQTVTAVADVRIDRSEYNIRYGSGSFFDNLGDKTIYDEFDLSVKLVTTN